MSRKKNNDEKNSCLLIGTELSFLGDSKRESIFIFAGERTDTLCLVRFFLKKINTHHWDSSISNTWQIMAAVSQKKKKWQPKVNSGLLSPRLDSGTTLIVAILDGQQFARQVVSPIH